MKIESAEFLRSAHRGEDLVRDGLPQVAFIGRSNVGKSSLMNTLLGRKGLARTSSTPGRTRSVNYFLVNRRCYFVDLPGYGYARAGKVERQAWADLAEAYLGEVSKRAAGARALVVQLVDAKVGATPLDLEAFEFLSSYGLRVVVVATKVDRLGRQERAKALRALTQSLRETNKEGFFEVSAKSGEGIRELWRALDEHLQTEASSKQERGMT